MFTRLPHLLIRKILTIAALVAFIVSTLILLGSQLPLFGHWQFYSVISGSMAPTLHKGTLIISQRLRSPTELQPNRIITFTIPGDSNRTVTHRLIGITQQEDEYLLTTKGDANAGSDPWTINSQAVIGQVVGFIPYLGTLLSFLKSPIGTISCIVIPLLIIIMSEIKFLAHIWQEREVALPKAKA